MCIDSNATTRRITNCIDTHGREAAHFTNYDGMNPLHLLAMNPYATPETIVFCVNANVIALFAKDERGKTPIDYL